MSTLLESPVAKGSNSRWEAFYENALKSASPEIRKRAALVASGESPFSTSPADQQQVATAFHQWHENTRRLFQEKLPDEDLASLLNQPVLEGAMRERIPAEMQTALNANGNKFFIHLQLKDIGEFIMPITVNEIKHIGADVNPGAKRADSVNDLINGRETPVLIKVGKEISLKKLSELDTKTQILLLSSFANFKTNVTGIDDLRAWSPIDRNNGASF